MPRREKSILPINPDILIWARERCGFDVQLVSQKIQIKPERLVEWEAGKSSPTPRQGRRLAKLYERPFLEFFSSTRPHLREVTLAPDFRVYLEGPSDSEKRSLRRIQQWAEEHRLNALDLIEEVGDTPTLLSDDLHFSTDHDVEYAASVSRQKIGFSINDQLTLSASERGQLPSILRRHIEQRGVLVLKENRLTQLRTRGICLFANPLPIIVFGSEAPSAQAFTIIHEFGHVLLGLSAISGSPQFGSNDQTGSRAVESWCNRFSASFLIPSKALKDKETKPPRPTESYDLGRLAELAKEFSISKHVMLIRLVNLGYVRPSFYWDKMRGVFLEEEREYRSFGRPPYYGKRYVNSKGEFYTGLVLEAWSSGAITGHNAAEYMGITNLAHLRDIRNEYRI